MEELDNLYLDYVRKTKFLKEQTKKKYLKMISTIQSKFWNKPVSVEWVLNHPDDFEKHLHSYASVNKNAAGESLGDHTKDMFFSSMISLFIYNQELREKHKELYDHWKQLHDKIRGPINNKYKSNEPTERQKKGFVPYEEIVKVRDSLRPGTMTRLLISMYTEIPAVRVDFYKVRIYDEMPKKLNEKDNIIVLGKNPVIILQDYKTSKKYGKITIPIPESLQNEIYKSLDIFPRDYLFVSSRTGKPYNTKDAFRLWANNHLKHLFNPHFNLTTFRHAFISRRDLMLERKSGLEKEEVSRIMGHSLDQQSKYSFHTWLDKKEKN